MTKEPKSEITVPLRIVLVAPPPGVDFGIQEGKGNDYKTIAIQRSKTGNLVFECTINVKGNRADGQPTFGGPISQGPPTGRFIYIDIGKSAGQIGSCWQRRIKIPLEGLTWEMIDSVLDRSKRLLQATILGTGKDGGPSCATVRPIDGWKVVEALTILELHAMDNLSSRTLRDGTFEMTKWVLWSFALIFLFIGCDSNRKAAFVGTGEYLVPKVNLPERVAELADALEQFPRKPQKSDLATVLKMAGLSSEPDGYKESVHWWYLDANFDSNTSLEKAYVISIGYWPNRNSSLQLFNAAIHRLDPAEPGRETVWEIDYQK